MQKHKVEFNVLCVLSQANVEKPREIYRFFRGLGIDYIQFIPLSEFDTEGNRLPFTITPEQYGRFMCEIFDLWWPERRKVRIRFFDNLAEALAGQKPGNCTMHETCDSYVVVEYNGDVYPCDFFVEKRLEAGQRQPGLLAGDRPPPAALPVRRQQDAAAPGVPGLRVAVPLPRRLPEVPQGPAPPLRRPGLLLPGVQDDLRQSGRPAEEGSRAPLRRAARRRPPALIAGGARFDCVIIVSEAEIWIGPRAFTY